MTSDEQNLGKQLREAQRRADGDAPPFAATWAAAQAHRSRRPANAAAAVVAIAALIAAVLLDDAPDATVPDLIDKEELVASTTWVAPSDSLLPEHRFDIFQELPELFESTGTEEGTLL